MSKSTNRPKSDYTENAQFKENERDETEKIIYRNRKANHLSIYRGLERREGKTFEYYFKKLTKFLIDGNKSIK